MPIYSKQWENIPEADWNHFAEEYLSEITRNQGKEYEDGEHYWGQLVVEFQFTSSPDLQWNFILLAVKMAESNEQLEDIAAGGIEHLLGWHGDAFIDIVEKEAASNVKFAKALTGVWKYKMTDEIWDRVQALQEKAAEKLT